MYKVRLLNAGDNKLKVAKFLNNTVTGSLKPAVKMMQSAPIDLTTFTSYTDTKKFATLLEAIGAKVEITEVSD